MRRLALGVVALFSLVLTACANDPVREGTPYHQMPAAAAANPGIVPTNVAQGRDAAYQYHLGTSDKVRIITFNEASLTGEFVVNSNGAVSLPLIGDVHAAGLTTNELAVAIQNSLKNGYLTDPQVSVEVLNYRPFYILGEVVKPGEYPFANGLTVLNAVATANGFTYRADTHRVFIKRANETAEHEVDLTTTTPVEPGDTIRIKERLF